MLNPTYDSFASLTTFWIQTLSLDKIYDVLAWYKEEHIGYLKKVMPKLERICIMMNTEKYPNVRRLDFSLTNNETHKFGIVCKDTVYVKMQSKDVWTMFQIDFDGETFIWGKDSFTTNTHPLCKSSNWFQKDTYIGFSCLDYLLFNKIKISKEEEIKLPKFFQSNQQTSLYEVVVYIDVRNLRRVETSCDVKDPDVLRIITSIKHRNPFIPCKFIDGE